MSSKVPQTQHKAESVKSGFTSKNYLLELCSCFCSRKTERGLLRFCFVQQSSASDSQRWVFQGVQPAVNHFCDLNVRLEGALVIFCHNCDFAIVEKRVLEPNKFSGKMTCDLSCCPGRQKMGMAFIISALSDVQAFNPVILK